MLFTTIYNCNSKCFDGIILNGITLFIHLRVNENRGWKCLYKSNNNITFIITRVAIFIIYVTFTEKVHAVLSWETFNFHHFYNTLKFFDHLWIIIEYYWYKLFKVLRRKTKLCCRYTFQKATKNEIKIIHF